MSDKNRFDQPLFITFEGGEGSGKSTQSKMLYEYLLSKRIEVIHTREVGGTAEAEKIRNLLVLSNIYPMSQLMLVMAARYEHVNKVILPALNEGKWVICDRFVDSSACYQTDNSGLTIEEVFELHAKLIHLSYENDAENMAHRDVDITQYDAKGRGVMPDLTFFMDIEPEIARERALNRGNADNYDRKPLSYYKQVHDKFHFIAARDPERVKTVACQDKSAENIHKEVLEHIFGQGVL